MSYAAEKHEPKTMKAKADLMLKKGSISEKQHKKLHAKADVEIGKAKAAKLPKPDALSAKGGDKADGATDKPEADADATETKAKRKSAIKDDVMRGEPGGAEEKDQ
jgi:hypothetical protein